MKNKSKNLYLIIGLYLLSMSTIFLSCIREEALNTEADIVSIKIPKDLLKRTPIIEDTQIICNMDVNADLTSLAPEFTITEGASIMPKSGTKLDFTNPQIYTVTSQDGKWQKKYTIKCIKTETANNFHFNFFKEGVMDENNPNNKFHIIYEKIDATNTLDWSSGNKGYSILASGKAPEEYPTSFSENGYKGGCAKLVTRSTGALGAMFGSPMAAGNIFTGKFKLNIANALKSTLFGIEYKHEPLKLTGYYKYKSGKEYKQFTDSDGNKISGGKVLDIKDECSIYAVFFEITDGVEHLDGENILTHKNIISIAKLENSVESADWKKFDIDFKLKEGKSIDSEKLKNGKYNIAIVFSSSKDGDKFNGAVGSTLYIDEVQLISKKQ